MSVTYPDQVDASQAPWVKREEEHCRFVTQELIDRGFLTWDGERLVASPELLMLVAGYGREEGIPVYDPSKLIA